MSEELQELMHSNPEWYKNLQFDAAKKFIQDNINSASRSFIAVGYYLKYIKDNKMYVEDGYSGILEFAQAEFGISKSWASKWMSINDKFSVNGNSPILLQQYQNFSSSKLSEMLYLTDEQLEQVAITTTRAEIRDIGKPIEQDKSVSHAKTEPSCFIRDDINKGSEKDLKCSGGISEDCKTCDKLVTEKVAISQVEPEPSPVIDKLSDCPPDIKQCVRQEWGLEPDEQKKGSAECKKCWKDWEKFHSVNKQPEDVNTVPKNIDSEPDIDDEFLKCSHNHELQCNIDNVVKVAATMDDVDCNGVCCWNCNENCGEKCNSAVEHQYKENDIPEIVNNEHEIVDNKPEIVDDVDESVTEIAETVIEEPESVIPERECSNCNYNTITPKEYYIDHPDTDIFPCNDCNDMLNHWEPKVDGLELVCFNREEGWHKEIIIDDPEPVETVEADIIQTVPDELPKPIFSAKYHLKEAIQREEEQLKQLGETWKAKQPDTFLKHQTILIALKCHLTDMEYPDPVPSKPVQPELPILKNNDQRKDWIDAYNTWPIWIDQKETGERYYRYDFDNGESFVIRVSLHHSWEHGKYTKTTSYGKEEYYILTNTKKYDHEPDNKTFCECSTNKSFMTEYLKDLQKK